MLSSSHIERERSKTHWPEGWETDAEITFSFSPRPLTWQQDWVIMYHWTKCRVQRDCTLLEKSQFNLGRSYMFLGLPRQTQWVSVKTYTIRLKLLGKKLIVQAKTCCSCMAQPGFVRRKTWDGSDLVCAHLWTVTAWVHNCSFYIKIRFSAAILYVSIMY